MMHRIGKHNFRRLRNRGALGLQAFLCLPKLMPETRTTRKQRV